MSMRITNSMITMHSKTNINTTKGLVDMYQEQMTTQKKIAKPSDDPVIAIRSLRLRDSLNEVTQYTDKNIPDAHSWLELTETSLTNIVANLEDAYKACVKGENGPLTTEDKNTVLQTLQAISDAVYDEGNTDYAGRTVFTGYKTNKSLTFQEDTTNMSYSIDESFDIHAIKQKNEYTNVLSIPNNESDNSTGTETGWIAGYSLEDEMEKYTVDRIRLAYSNVGKMIPEIQLTGLKESPVMGTDGNVKMVSQTVMKDISTYQFRDKDLADPSRPAEMKTPLETVPADVENDVKALEKTAGELHKDKPTDVYYKQEIGNTVTEMYRSSTDLSVTETVTVQESAAKKIVTTTKTDKDGNVTVTELVTEIVGNKKFETETTTKKYADGEELKLPATGLQKAKVKEIKQVIEKESTYDTATKAYVEDPDQTVTTLSVKEEELTLKAGSTTEVEPSGNWYTTSFQKKEAATDFDSISQYSLRSISLQDWEKNKFKDKVAGKEDEYLIPDKNTIYYIPETGEMILGSEVSKAFKADALDRENNKQDPFKLDVTYDKNIFKRGEVRPEMYFNCVDKTNPDPKEQIHYIKEDQDICYTVAANQELKVNTQAGQNGILSTDIGRDIEELTNAITAAQNANDKVEKIKAMKNNPLYSSEEQQAKLDEWMEAAQKELTLLEDQLKGLFADGITKFQNYKLTADLAKTDVGSRVSRLKLTETRMTTSKQTLNTLIKDNEDRNLSDILIDFKAANNTYDSALKAAAKINELSLLNYL
ncbi:MAG: hypothetical protein E7280_01120 [Lachnospiraceae bacterium]|nr:hypothetical protein [Lachnospiraceae bacterium]